MFRATITYTGEACGRTAWVTMRDGKFYRGTIYTRDKDAALLTAEQVEALKASTPPNYEITALEVTA